MKLSSLFNVKYGVNLELINCQVTDKNDINGVNFVARTSVNNGVVAFVKKIEGIKPQLAGTLSCASGGSTLSTFVQVREYYSGRDLFVLTPLNEMTLNEKLYYAMCIKENAYRYGYGRQANKTLSDLNLPDKIPDWVNRINIQPITTTVFYNDLTCNINTWKEFTYDDIFNIVRGESQYIQDMNKGVFPYISASSANNGISGYVDIYNQNGNSITLNYDGSIGDAFYHPDRYFASEKVAVITLKNSELNKYIAMFLVSLFRLEKFRFSYGLKWSIDNKMRKSIIKLPVLSDGSPDYQYMENYIKLLPYSDRI
jgi:hypothetical protein